MVDVKFCGLTRAEDARYAAILGARYCGVIFAKSARQLDGAQARAVASAAHETGAKVVGVFGEQTVADIVAAIELAGLDVVQLHGSVDAPRISAIRSHFSGELWTVSRVESDALPDGTEALFDSADGVVLDTYSRTTLGGSGRQFNWRGVSAEVARLRGTTRLIVAGGLRADNVRVAVEALSPDVVDVSSGVESSPGIKDHQRMREFMEAVREPVTR